MKSDIYNMFNEVKSNLKLINLSKECKNYFDRLFDNDIYTLTSGCYENIIAWSEIIHQKKIEFFITNQKHYQLDFFELLKEKIIFEASDSLVCNNKISENFIKHQNLLNYSDYFFQTSNINDYDYFKKIIINILENNELLCDEKLNNMNQLFDFIKSMNSKQNLDLYIDDLYFLKASFIFLYLCKLPLFKEKKISIASTFFILLTTINKFTKKIPFLISKIIYEKREVFFSKLNAVNFENKNTIEEFLLMFLSFVKKSILDAISIRNYLSYNMSLTNKMLNRLTTENRDIDESIYDIFSKELLDQIDFEYSFNLNENKLETLMEFLVNKKCLKIVGHHNHNVYLVFWWVENFFYSSKSIDELVEHSKHDWLALLSS